MPANNGEREVLAGEVAKLLGVGVQTLHFYEREGLIPGVPRTPAGYRVYPDFIVERVRFIRQAQALGLPLVEVKEILSLADCGGSPCGRVQEALEKQLDEVDDRLRELRRFRRELALLVERAKSDYANRPGARVCPIVEHADGPRPIPIELFTTRSERAGRRRHGDATRTSSPRRARPS